MSDELKSINPVSLDLDDKFDFDSRDWDDRPIEEVYGSSRNMAAYGPPSQNEEVRLRYYFYPTWRSQLISLIAFVICCIGSTYVSDFEYFVIKGRLFAIGDTMYFLHLPLAVLIPGFILGRVLIHMYDAKFIIDERGVEAQVGLVSLSLRQPRLRWEDIRGVEPNQTLWERFLGIGTVLIGSAMTNDVEIVMAGVANPRAIQLLIGSERDRHLKRRKAEGNDFRAIATSD